jgi:deazaflavin-dependent oxidoreductase (nitroreductase family)
MTISNPEIEERLRLEFKVFNYFMVGLWRLGLGGWVNFSPRVGGKILVITHKGRNSSKRYRTPVNYAVVNDEVYCMAGFGSRADWYRNILANPQVELWMPDGWWVGVAEDASSHPQAKEILRQVLIASGFVSRLFNLDPQTMRPEELEELLKTYRIVRLRPSAARTGKDGPGDLAWIWPLSTFLLLFMVLFKKKRR